MGWRKAPIRNSVNYLFIIAPNRRIGLADFLLVSCVENRAILRFAEETVDSNATIVAGWCHMM